MRLKDEAFLKETEALHNLRALEEIEKNPKISQRELALSLGVALGITNSLLKTLVRKGLIKIRGKNNRSLTYHLTHAGVLEKSAMAMRWTLNTLDFYREARCDVAAKLAAFAAQGVKSVALYGTGELAEIALIVGPEAGLRVVGVVDGGPVGEARAILGCPVVCAEDLSDLEIDAVIVCADGEGAVDHIGRFVDANTNILQLF